MLCYLTTLSRFFLFKRNALESHSEIQGVSGTHFSIFVRVLDEDEQRYGVDQDVGTDIERESDDVEFVAFGFDGSQFGDHGQVGDLNGSPAELEEAHQNDEQDDVARRVARFAQSHAPGEHERERRHDAYRPCSS